MPEDSPPTTNSGFGLRMEKVLRAAQREAAEILANAEQDAAALLSRARLEAETEERRRRRGWAEREQAVSEAVRAGAEEVAAAQREAVSIRDTVELEAQRIRGHAHNRAAEITAAAEETTAEAVRQSRLEVERLERVREAARADLDRLMRTLGGMRDALAYELETRPAPPADPAAFTAGPPKPGPQHPGSPNPGSPNPAAQTPAAQTPVPQPRLGRGTGIGNRPGDFRRARTAGIVPDPESGAEGSVHNPTHESATRS